jgi:archaellin
MVSHQITLRAWSTNADLPPIKINQGDILSRTVFITLISGGQAVDLTNSTARVHFSKPDGTVVYLTASIVNAAAGIISVTLDSQCTAVPGLVKSIVQVTGPDGENLFFVGLNFQVAVVNIEDSIVSSNEFTALTDALAQVQNIANKADLNTDGKVIQDPASYGRANGGATLNTDGKVIQDPASYGQVGGAALISNLPQSPQLVMLHPDGTLSTAGGLPQSDDGKGPQHYTVYPDGRLHEWGYQTTPVTITSPYGSMYLFEHFTIGLINNFVSDVSAHVNIASSGALVSEGATLKTGTQNTLDFSVLSPVSVSNISATFMYDIWGWWRT